MHEQCQPSQRHSNFHPSLMKHIVEGLYLTKQNVHQFRPWWALFFFYPRDEDVPAKGIEGVSLD